MKRKTREEIRQELKEVNHKFKEGLEKASFQEMKRALRRIEVLCGELAALEGDEYLERLKTK